jgi:hypothetical protein
MKTLVTSKTPSKQVLLSEVKDTNLIGIEADNTKYILSPMFNNEYVTVGFLNGKSRWSSSQSVDSLIKEAQRDNRVTIFVFDTIGELADWYIG